jgi:hypothetical protein
MTQSDNVIRVGQLWRDRRKDNIRTLRVDRVDENGQVHLVVIRQVYQGEATEPMRPTSMTSARLLSRNFVLEQEAER